MNTASHIPGVTSTQSVGQADPTSRTAFNVFNDWAEKPKTGKSLAEQARHPAGSSADPEFETACSVINESIHDIGTGGEE